MGLNGAAAGSRRMRLKQATASLHQRIDDHLTRAGFLDDRSAYGRYLIRTLRARGAMEAALDRSGAERVYRAWPQRRIAEALRQDLADLALTPDVDSNPAPAILDRAGMLGALYVLEGASAGARLIARRVTALGVNAGFGARHLGLQTADGAGFRGFVALLDEADLTAEEEETCRTAAISTFEVFDRCYTAQF